MLCKLIVRNAKRSMKDYLVYLITMGGVAAFMYAFDSLVFSDMVQGMLETAMIMAAMIGIVTVFIVCIVAWLINYMVRFMLEKRSSEFGTYLLLGMEKKQVSKLYMGENMLLGLISFLVGLFAGMILQQIVMAVFYHLFSMDYEIQIGTSPWCIVMTLGCYILCYVMALRKNRKIFKKMTISDFMDMEKQGEAVETGREKWKQLLFFASVIYFGIFTFFLFQGQYSPVGVIVATVFFIVAIYCFYQGLAAFLVRYIKRGGRKVYQRDGLFLLRQLSAKMRTMRFTMGTLTVLFTAALLGGTVAMMFSSYQKEAIQNAIPWDIQVYSSDVEETYEREKDFLEKEGVIPTDEIIYRIYRDGETHEMNDYLYVHVSNLLGEYTNEDGSLKEEAVADGWYCYYEYDTYMALSDYNYLRSMLGYESVTLQEGEYAIHLKNRILRDVEPSFFEKDRTIGGISLQYEGCYTEAFGQNGMNGADYIFVVPDEVAKNLTPYYSMLAMNIDGTAPAGLQQRFEEEYYHVRGLATEEEVEVMIEELENKNADEAEIMALVNRRYEQIPANGTDQVISVGSYDVIVKDNLEMDLIGIISSVTFPLAYISLIFLCVAFTILAVQQLSDAGKYRYRYDVLRKLGVNEKELSLIIFKQLAMYYLIPIIVALLLSGVIGIFAGDRFVFYTGADNNAFFYYGISVLAFAGVYLLYFAATYLGFKRNVEQVFVRME